MKIEFKNGSVIEVVQTLDTHVFRGQGIGIWIIFEDDEENDVSE